MLSVTIVESMDRFLSEAGGSLANQIICPNSSFADAHPARNVRSISDFMREQGTFVGPDTRVVKDDELMLALATIFKTVCPGTQKEYFFQAFRAFKDLRSYTLDVELVGECLDRFDGSVARAVRAFWHYVDEFDIIDEHKLCHLIGERYRNGRSTTLLKGRRFVLAGFRHLTAHQIDMFKFMGLGNDIVVPVDRYVYGNSLNTDWFRWFDTEADGGEDFGLEGTGVKTVFYPKNRLAEYMVNFVPDTKNFTIVLCQKEPNFCHFNEISAKNASFKYRETVLEPLADEIFEEIKLRYFSRETSVRADILEDYLNDKVKHNIEAQDFRRIKVASIFGNELKTWRGLSDINTDVSGLEAEIFKEIIHLKLPKLYGHRMAGTKGSRISGIDEILTIDRNRETLIVASSNYELLDGESGGYDHETMEVLGSIGPVRRKGLETLSFKKEVLDVLGRDTTTLFMEDRLADDDTFWREMKDFVECRALPLALPARERVDYLDREEKKAYVSTSYSASKIQGYMDCPRKFYYSFVDPLPSRFGVSNALDAASMGTLEHRVIGLFFEDGGSLDDLVERELKAFLKDEGIGLSGTDYRIAFNEVRHYSGNGIDFVQRLREEFLITDFYFEKRIEDGRFKGRADFVAMSPKGEIVIDFKRSNSSIPGKGKMERLQDIQIFYYTHHLGFRLGDVALMGFFCLSEPEKSWLIGRDGATLDKVTVRPLNEAYGKAFMEYPLFESEQIEKMERENIFAANPVDFKTCNYCTVRHICPREFLQ